MIIKIIVSMILAYLIMRMIVPYFSKIASTVGLMDKVGAARKIHTTNIPAIGGITMGISLLLSMSMHVNDSTVFSGLAFSLLIGAFLLLVTGIVDDKVDLSPFFKLTIQFCCAYFLVVKGVYFDQVFDLIQLGFIPMQLKMFLSSFFIVGVINAYNLIDGIDGLAGSFFLVSFAWFGAVAYFMGMMDIAFLSLVILSVVFAFLRFNTSREEKIFMGDGGSLLLGFLLAGTTIAVMEGSATSSNAPEIMMGSIALLGIPVFDEIRVFITRMNAGRSPFYADKSHIHHILLQINPEHAKVNKWIMAIAVGTFTTSVLLATISGWLLASGWLLLCFTVLWLVLTQQRNMSSHRQILRQLEKPYL